MDDCSYKSRDRFLGISKIEQRRHQLLAVLDQLHPLAIFTELKVDTSVGFLLSQGALFAIRKAVSQPIRRRNESVGLGTVQVAGRTPDDSQILYGMSHLSFKAIGGKDSVMALDHERLNPGEIELHTHLPSAPDYLGQTDVGDLIAAIEGPAWVHPTTKLAQPHLRIFGILSILRHHQAQLDFYKHNLNDDLSAANNFGLYRAGYPVLIPNAY